MEQREITEIIARVVQNLTAEESNWQQAAQSKNGSELTAEDISKPGPADVTLRMAKKLIEYIEAEASRMGLNVVIAVTNKGARPVAVHCMDEAYIASYDIALNKAYTSAALKMPTAALKRFSQPGGELYGIQHTNGGQIVIFGGGVPVTYNGNVIGGLGISGGSEAQDTALAEFGEKIIKEALDIWQ